MLAWETDCSKGFLNQKRKITFALFKLRVRRHFPTIKGKVLFCYSGFLCLNFVSVGNKGKLTVDD